VPIFVWFINSFLSLLPVPDDGEKIEKIKKLKNVVKKNIVKKDEWKKSYKALPGSENLKDSLVLVFLLMVLVGSGKLEMKNLLFCLDDVLKKKLRTPEHFPLMFRVIIGSSMEGFYVLFLEGIREKGVRSW
jgi:hypothetical protein